MKTEKLPASKFMLKGESDKSLMQEYDQHLIGLGVKTGTMKEHLHPHKNKKSKSDNQCHHFPRYVLPTHASISIYGAKVLLFPQEGHRGSRDGHRGYCHRGTTPSEKQQPPQ